MIRTLALVTALAITVKCQDDGRPFYVIGHMVNSIPQVSQFLELGANAIESDVEFSKSGTALRTFHGLPCDCLRRCKQSANIVDYFQYIRNVTGFRHSQYSEKLLLVFLDLKVSKLPPGSKYGAGVDIATKLVLHLWDGVPFYDMMNVLLSIGRASDMAVLTGVIDTIIGFDPSLSLFNHLGFDVGLNDKLENIAKMYERLGVNGHRWQGDGITNCLTSLRCPLRLKKTISYRDTNKRESYVDKVYYWTVDKVATIRKTIRRGVDAIITNRPKRVTSVLAEDELKKTVRLATYRDDPWMRLQSKTTERGPTEPDSDTDEMGDEASEFDFEPFSYPLSPRRPLSPRSPAIRDSYNVWPQYNPLSPFY
ncbi:dermonecrotic toxin SPH-like [Ixodes scapularis]|uniref:dermonecrotic toxin SPH-like n=1 Tax=Ixodes scapularis TaxID=6945 RepID=UPI001A9F9F0E|nr:dermonecrotic toxin SPH-like [Ixodes scapularis]